MPNSVIFNLPVDLLVVVTVAGELRQVNPAAERILGFTAGQLTGRSLYDFVHPDDRQAAAAEVAILESGRPLHGLRLRCLRADGSYRWIAFSANPPENGEFFAVGRDVTDEKIAEDHQLRLQVELERAAREWRLTFDSIDNAIMIIDRFGAVTRLNAAARRLSGRSYDDVLGRTLTLLGGGEPWPAAADLVSAAIADASPQWRQAHDRASGRSFDVHASPIPGAEQRTILVIRDITSLVQLQDSLRRSETMSAMGQLVAGVAHEVRNPLFSMSATLDAFEATGGQTQGSRHLAVMRNQLVRLTHLMEDLLEYGKPPSLQLGPAVLSQVLAEAADACDVLAGQHGVAIVREVPEDLPPVLADRRRLVQVFANLFANAIQHSASGAIVTARAGRSAAVAGAPAGIECAVLDTGPGFASSDLPHLFEPFFTKRRGGTGLGLALVQRIVEQHGGSVEAMNRDDGGAAIRVRLRIAPPAETA